MEIVQMPWQERFERNVFVSVEPARKAGYAFNHRV